MISILEDIVAGGAAGALGVFIGVPFDTCKVRMQSMPSKFKTGFQTFRDTLKLEGVAAFYKGSSAPIAAQFVICAFAFAGESFGIKMLEPPSSRAQPSSLNAFLAGSFGGLVQCFALVPSDLVKCKMQVDSNSSLRQCEFSSVSDCIRKTVNSEGIAGLFRGMGISALREVRCI
jgi:solute carrier family 25 (mitochondrial carnitine/acylcarnitine transporter), member 20/29